MDINLTPLCCFGGGVLVFYSISLRIFASFNQVKDFIPVGYMIRILLSTIFIIILSKVFAQMEITPDSISSIDTTLQPTITPGTDILQTRERLDSAKIYTFYNNFDEQGPDFITEIDTNITNIEKYDPLIKPNNYFASLGNVGLAHTSLVYNPYIKSGFDFGIHSLDQYLFHNDSITYYWVGRPYTHLQYIMGSKQEQNLHIEHSQNVADWFNIGLYFRYINSPGFYTNQKADDKNFALKMRFQTKNYRYMVLSNYIHNKNKIEENGGIIYDSVFTENVKTNRRNISVNLTSANNLLKENSYYVKQLFKLNKSHRFRRPDSTEFSSNKIDPGSVSHSFLLSKFTHLYEHSPEDHYFYDLIIDTNNSTYDSSYIYKIENQLSWTNANNFKRQHLAFSVNVKHQYVELAVDSANYKYNHIIPSANLQLQISKFLKLDLYGDFVIGNSFSGDFLFDGDLTLKTKYGSLRYSNTIASHEVARFYSQYSSNHFVWDNSNSFKKQNHFINEVEYSFKNFHAGVEVTTIGNLIYMNELASPSQLENSASIFNSYIRQLFKLNNFSIDARLIYQTTTDNEAIRLPELIGDFSFYYTKDLFEQATILQTGIDMFYNTSYYAYNYMPAIKSFFIQNDEKIGDYLYANAFLSLQIKRARLFVKYHNLGFLLQNFSYYTVPSYPMQDGSFRFGLSWMFYD